jgi:hypothetical protein
MDYRCRYRQIEFRVGKNAVPLALVGSGGPQVTPLYGGRGRPLSMVVTGTSTDTFVFFAARVQPIEDGPGRGVTKLGLILPWLSETLEQHIRAIKGDLERFDEKLQARLQPHASDLVMTIHEGPFRLMPTHSVYDEIAALYRVNVLGRSIESLKRLEPPGVWARELFDCGVYSARRREEAT